MTWYGWLIVAIVIIGAVYAMARGRRYIRSTSVNYGERENFAVPPGLPKTESSHPRRTTTFGDN